jgi:uncharacterized membrane protein
MYFDLSYYILQLTICLYVLFLIDKMLYKLKNKANGREASSKVITKTIATGFAKAPYSVNNKCKR